MLNHIDYGNTTQVQNTQAQLRSEQELEMSLECPKCGEYHEDVRFIKFKEPVEEGGIKYTHYSECPTNQLQLKLAWRPPEEVANRQRAMMVEGLGDKLRMEDMNPDDIEKVLSVIREMGQDGDDV